MVYEWEWKMNSMVQQAQPRRQFFHVDLCEVFFPTLKPKHQNNLNVKPDLQIPASGGVKPRCKYY